MESLIGIRRNQHPGREPAGSIRFKLARAVQFLLVLGSTQYRFGHAESEDPPRCQGDPGERTKSPADPRARCASLGAEAGRPRTGAARGEDEGAGGPTSGLGTFRQDQSGPGGQDGAPYPHAAWLSLPEGAPGRRSFHSRLPYLCGSRPRPPESRPSGHHSRNEAPPGVDARRAGRGRSGRASVRGKVPKRVVHRCGRRGNARSVCPTRRLGRDAARLDLRTSLPSEPRG